MPWVMVIEHGRCRRRRRRLARASALLFYIERRGERSRKWRNSNFLSSLFSSFLFHLIVVAHTAIVVFALMPLCTRTRYHSVSFECVRFIQRPALESWNNSEPLSSFLFLLLFALPGETSYVLLCCTVMQEPFLPFQGPSYMYDQRVKRIRCNCNSISQAKAISFVEIACRVSFSGSPVIGRRPGRVPRSFFVIIIFLFIFFCAA